VSRLTGIEDEGGGSGVGVSGGGGVLTNCSSEAAKRLEGLDLCLGRPSPRGR
jgi:hypothetical protein